MNVKSVIGAVAHITGGVTLYTSKGQEIFLPSDSWSTQLILEKVTPYLSTKTPVDIDLSDYAIERQVEKKTNGLVRFVRKVGAKVSSLFSNNDGSTHRVEETIQKESLVAIINGKEIPGLEQIESHLKHAAEHGSKGIEEFLRRVSNVIDERGHSIQELLNFLNRADLPIADDGSIVAYKTLYARSDFFVDCHTRRVPQRLGSRVSMPIGLVDADRRTQCSTGLHIARRHYLEYYHGDVVTIVKIAPEDVIAVPASEPAKMRVAAYHIVGVLSDGAAKAIFQGRSIKGFSEDEKLLASVIAGDHIEVIENVVINGKYGQDIVVTQLNQTGQSTPEKPASSGKVELVEENAATVDIGKVRKIAETAKKTAAKRVSAQKVSQPIAPTKPIPAELSERQKKILELYDSGMSLRKMEKALRMCRKTMRKTIDAYRP